MYIISKYTLIGFFFRLVSIVCMFYFDNPVVFFSDRTLGGFSGILQQFDPPVSFSFFLTFSKKGTQTGQQYQTYIHIYILFFLTLSSFFPCLRIKQEPESCKLLNCLNVYPTFLNNLYVPGYLNNINMLNLKNISQQT